MCLLHCIQVGTGLHLTLFLAWLASNCYCDKHNSQMSQTQGSKNAIRKLKEGTFCTVSVLHLKIQASSKILSVSSTLVRTAKKSVWPLVEGGSVGIGLLQVFVGNCNIKKFSQRAVTAHFYAAVCGCRCSNCEQFSANLGILCLALDNVELQGSTAPLLVAGLGGNGKLQHSSFRWSHGHWW